MSPSEAILDVRNLIKLFPTPKGFLHAVDDISFSIQKGKTLGLVGESGCGKSTTGRTVLRLIEPSSGQVFFERQEITKLNKQDMRKMRKDMQIIFQDPFSSLDPRKSVRQIISEPILLNKLVENKEDISAKTRELMDVVGLSNRFELSFPHELDGGRRQRVGIARALAVNPKFIVCDEPVSALDVSIQAQILNLMKDLQERLSLTYLFITHNLSVVNYFSDEIAVMYLGRIIEKAPTEELFLEPYHPYTNALLSAIPIPDLKHRSNRTILKGEIGSPINPQQKCRFEPRCKFSQKICNQVEPELTDVGNGHLVACHFKELFK